MQGTNVLFGQIAVVFGIVIAGDTAPTHDELSAAARSFDLGIITLTAR